MSPRTALTLVLLIFAVVFYTMWTYVALQEPHRDAAQRVGFCALVLILVVLVVGRFAWGSAPC